MVSDCPDHGSSTSVLCESLLLTPLIVIRAPRMVVIHCFWLYFALLPSHTTMMSSSHFRCRYVQDEKVIRHWVGICKSILFHKSHVVHSSVNSLMRRAVTRMSTRRAVTRMSAGFSKSHSNQPNMLGPFAVCTCDQQHVQQATWSQSRKITNDCSDWHMLFLLVAQKNLV